MTPRKPIQIIPATGPTEIDDIINDFVESWNNGDESTLIVVRDNPEDPDDPIDDDAENGDLGDAP